MISDLSRNTVTFTFVLIYFQIMAYGEENEGTAMRSLEWRAMEHTWLHKEPLMGCRGHIFSCHLQLLWFL